MTIAETIYQHVKTMLLTKAVEVLHFVEFLKTKPDVMTKDNLDNEALVFIQNLPVGQRTDTEINNNFQALRDEWQSS
jgi:hypothetical protein